MATTKTPLLLIFLMFVPTGTVASHNITAIFMFGDSIVDPGNNNNLTFTISKTNHPPYGHDFPGRVPTGRSSNGKLLADFLVSKLGLKELLPAYLDPTLTDKDLLTGCSFGSASAGLDDVTTSMSNVISLTTQLGYFEQAKKRMERIVGSKEAGRVVENALFMVVAGTNDMANNFYLLPMPLRKDRLEGYHELLLGNLKTIIMKLYGIGARKIGAMGLPPIGCLPVQMTVGLDILQRKCINQQNIDSQSYNTKLRALTSSIQQTLPGSRIVYVDIYDLAFDMITNQTSYGFEVSNRGCCGTGLLEIGTLCNYLDPICEDPSKYIFWDAVHPSQAAYSFAANYFMQNVLPNFVA